MSLLDGIRMQFIPTVAKFVCIAQTTARPLSERRARRLDHSLAFIVFRIIIASFYRALVRT